MRYIGNKTKLLNFIGEFLREVSITDGHALDAFAGTASVGTFLKSKGFSVSACDVMTYSYVFQRAYIVADGIPIFERLSEDRDFAEVRQRRDFRSRLEARFAGQSELFGHVATDARPLDEVTLYLDTFVDPLSSFITKHFSADEKAGEHERMYFTRANGARIDAIRHKLHEWVTHDLLTEDEYYILLASLLEASDDVANTTGVYAAFVKSWQGNAKKDLVLTSPAIVTGTGAKFEAHQGDVNSIIGSAGHFDLLYLDPPYNSRQYSAYYHVPELIAKGWFVDEPELRGKTGLIPNQDKRSDWSSPSKCVAALEDLLSSADATHVVLSYNNEGIIAESEIERIFSERGIPSTYARVSREYARYRSDSDSDSRKYKADVVKEYLYYVRLP